jgi:hypothetical protein
VTYSAQLSWQAPTTRADGTPLLASELAGYEIYYTTDTAGVGGTFKITGGAVTAYMASNLSAGNYYFAMSAIDANGLKSPLSPMVTVHFGP